MKEERKMVVTSLFINALVIFAKIFSGLVFGSYTLIVGGYYTLCNFTSDFLGFSSSLVRGRKASKKEPFGYGKLPMYAMSSYGLIIVLVGLFVLIKAFFLKYDYIDLRIILPIMVIVFSLFVFAKILFKKGKDVQSEMLMDITHDTYFDGIISVIGIFFIVLGSFMPIFDLLGVIFVSLLIINKGIKIIVDATNDLLKKVLPYHPFLIKPNHRELEELFNVKIENKEDLIHYARKLQEQGAINVLVSLGKDGAILVSEDTHVYYCAGAKGKLLNSVGSGDSMVAGFIAGYLKDKKYDEALKLGSACGGATAFSEDLAEVSMIQEVYKQLKVEEL